MSDCKHEYSSFVYCIKCRCEVTGDEFEAVIATLQAENKKLRDALIELSKLGNGDRPGNSIGNVIAQRALENSNE
jgi:hypothetical protein